MYGLDSRARRRRRWQSTALAPLLVVTLLNGEASAQQHLDPNTDVRVNQAAPTTTTSISVDQRDAQLGAGWGSSRDLAWATSGDATGFHLLVAKASDGYQWHTAATLSELGFDTDQWIGNACVTASGKRAVVVYAPRSFTNKEASSHRGGFTAAVDLESGAVTKLRTRSSLAYFSPGCGDGESAILTQEGDENLDKTRLMRVDAAAGTVAKPIEVPGQLTSAVPTREGIVGADSGALVKVSESGTRRLITPTTGVAFKIAPDADGGVVFMEHDKERVAVKRSVGGKVTTVATGQLSALDVSVGRAGRVSITGTADPGARTDVPSVSVIKAPRGAQLSTEGRLAVTSIRKVRQPDPRLPTQQPLAPQTVDITAVVPTTGKQITLTATPDLPNMIDPVSADLGRAPHPTISAPPKAQKQAADPHNPADFAERYCAVPRNDPANQAMQPKPRQVEWAVDQAVRHALTVQRPANWKNLNMPAYTPQGLFAPIPLTGGGFVPAQIMLAVAAQESNLWQAARSAIPGVTANPLVGNYYGIDYYNGNENDDWSIKWEDADCGYGVTQVTDRMRLAGKEKPGETALPYQHQRAVALDFAANIAAGVRILQGKWNQTRAAGLIVNNGDAARIENWFFAVWAYNSGFYPNAGNGQPWGVGWLNNPANPRYPANRLHFLEFTYQDAAHPQDWPYPEKIMGWAGHPIQALEAPDTFVGGYRAASWNGGDVDGPINRQASKPPMNQFCDASNTCEFGAKHLPNAPDVIGEKAGPCAHKNTAGQFDLKCWYHQPTTWKSDCNYSCGIELLRFDPGYAYQEDASNYPPTCTLGGLPSGALIVDDVPDGTASIRPNCGRPWNNAGTFTFDYISDQNGNYPGKVDTHQIGGGFGGHFWFTHTISKPNNPPWTIKATWKLNQARKGPMKVLVALPDHGAHTNLASYTVKTSRGDRTRVVRQPGTGNRWVSLGTFMFDGVPELSVTSITSDGSGEQDIAFDAAAFVPINGTHHEESVEAVGLFDEDQNTDTASPESWLGGNLASRQALYDWAVKSIDTIRGMPLCNRPAGDCLTPEIEQAVNRWRKEVLAAGTDPVNHPDGMSIARWIGFSNSYLHRPTSEQRPENFDSDAGYKVRNKATVSFVTGDDGKIIPGSEWTVYEHRTADTHLPRFALDFLEAIRADYDVLGFGLPNLTYRMPDFHVHDGAWASANPAVDGIMPGRAYATAGKAPVLTTFTGAVTEAGADCVAALTTVGASIGYRPMLSQSGPTGEMEKYSEALDNNVGVAQPVADLIEDIREMFFDPGPATGAESSIFGAAPPIWQELNFRACSDGSVRNVSNRPILRTSWMPSQYLYHNNRAMALDGAYSGSSAPVSTGNFQTFSQTPVHTDSPYKQCSPESGHNGNPWGIAPLDPPGVNPFPARFCLDPNLPSDPSHSSNR
jgi:hypothetical protein